MSQTRVALEDLPGRFDLVVIGGGVVGAGILREAARTGASVLLVEQNDFASGTSGASSNLMHGGMRDFRDGQWRRTLEAVRERNRLLRMRGGLVEPQPFLIPVYAGMKPGMARARLGLVASDLVGGQWRSHSLSVPQALALEPNLCRDGLLGALVYEDARTDDARLVLRLIFEAAAMGALALNYVRVVNLLKSSAGVRGVALRDMLTGATREIVAGIVVGAAGASSVSLPGGPGGAPQLRPLRGSHLVFPLAKLPLRVAVSWLHPRDRRPVFVHPWDGVALLGATDLDHAGDDSRPRMTAEEAAYLIEALDWQFPQMRLTPGDATSCYSAVRLAAAGGKAESPAGWCESLIWSSPGWIGVAGGRFTTLRVTAKKVLSLAAGQLPQLAPRPAEAPLRWRTNRAEARYGSDGAAWLGQSLWSRDRETIGATPYSWGELRWAARREAVARLDDLMLRRTRLGVLLPEGAAAVLDHVAAICRDELGWGELRWVQERNRYLDLWRRQHAVQP